MCMCHYIAIGIVAVPAGIVGMVFLVHRIKQDMKTLRELRRKRLFAEQQLKEQRILESTRFMYRSSPPR